MSRFDGHFDAAGEVSLDPTEIARLLSSETLASGERRQAMACYLSASEGWNEARRYLGGAFAGTDRRRKAGLMEG